MPAAGTVVPIAALYLGLSTLYSSARKALGLEVAANGVFVSKNSKSGSPRFCDMSRSRINGDEYGGSSVAGIALHQIVFTEEGLVEKTVNVKI